VDSRKDKIVDKYNHRTMDLNKKELYLSPEVKTVEVKIVGVVCDSGNG